MTLSSCTLMQKHALQMLIFLKQVNSWTQQLHFHHCVSVSCETCRYKLCFLFSCIKLRVYTVIYRLSFMTAEVC